MRHPSVSPGFVEARAGGGKRGGVRRPFDASLAKLGLDHVDLDTVHWPSADVDIAAVVETLAALREEGRTRAVDGIGTQVALAWLLDQDGVTAIPKAGRPESQRANLDALRIRLDDEDRAAVAALPKDLRCVAPPFAPDWDA